MEKEVSSEASDAEDRKEYVEDRKSFRKELEDLINCSSLETASDTPDFILSEYLTDCLEIFDKAVNRRTEWHKN